MKFGFTNKILAENEVLKKRLDYIKDLIEEYFEEPEKDTIGFLLKLKDISSGKCCNTCKYWAYPEEVCVNADSEFRADFTLPNHSCKQWIEREFIWIKTCDACPEQYDIYNKNNERVAYVRERHNHLTVEVNDLGNPIIFEIDDIKDKTVMDYKYEIENAIKEYKG